jgi:hypothetical protein
MFHRLFTQVRNNAVAYAALFIALGGTALAASSALPRNSVGTAQLKKRAVTGSKVALHTLSGANIKSSTLDSFQQAITGKCPRGHAIQAVSRKGKVTCQSVGAIARVVAGTGLRGGGSSGAVALSVDPRVVQARVKGSCPPGRAITAINPVGTVACHTTDVTELMGGTGSATLTPPSDFMAPVGINAPSTQAQAAAVGSSDVRSKARHLFVTVATAPGSGAGWKFDLYVDGRDRTGLKCVIIGSARSCRSGGAVSIPRGATIALHAIGTSTAARTTATYGWTDTTF